MRNFEHSHESHPGTFTLTLVAGEDPFLLVVQTYVWLVTKSVAITSADLLALRALPGGASWPQSLPGKILKKCEWRGRAEWGVRAGPRPHSRAGTGHKLPGSERRKLIGERREDDDDKQAELGTDLDTRPDTSSDPGPAWSSVRALIGKWGQKIASYIPLPHRNISMKPPSALTQD